MILNDHFSNLNQSTRESSPIAQVNVGGLYAKKDIKNGILIRNIIYMTGFY